MNEVEQATTFYCLIQSKPNGFIARMAQDKYVTLSLHSTAGPKISKKWKVRLILNFLIWASWMERCINVVFMNLFVNINKQYQNNCLSIIHFKSFTDGSFKFSLQRGTIGMFLSNFNLFKIRYLFLLSKVEKSFLFGHIILN